MVSENQTELPRRTPTTIVLNQSGLLDLLSHLRLANVTDRARSATKTLRQELIVGEAKISLAEAANFNLPFWFFHRDEFRDEGDFAKSSRQPGN